MQVSMDGPSVNLKFLDELIKDPVFNNESDSIITIGVCGLHVIHGSFQTGHKAVNWNVNSTLRGMYRLFKDSPARRADYTKMTGSTVFPLKFCSTRWVENRNVAERALDTFKHVEKFVKASKLPGTVSAQNVKAAISDDMTLPRIAFFHSVAALVEPFLKQFQSGAPMVPFLYEEIEKLMRNVMQRFIKSSALSEANTVKKLMTLDLVENSVSYKAVDMGVKAKSLLTKSTASDRMKMQFRMECITYLRAMTEKIRERSPLNYKFTRLAACLSPWKIVRDRETTLRRFGEMVELLHLAGKIKSTVADKAKSEFQTFVVEANGEKKEIFKNFSMANDRLDDFYSGLLDDNYSSLFDVVKLVLIMSRGQAQVESGFSVNGDILVENLIEESVVAQRLVYSAILSAGGVLKINYEDKSLLSAARSAHANYLIALDERKNKQSEEEKRSAEKRIAAIKVKELKAKRIRLAEEAAKDQQELEKEIERLSRY